VAAKDLEASSGHAQNTLRVRASYHSAAPAGDTTTAALKQRRCVFICLREHIPGQYPNGVLEPGSVFGIKMQQDDVVGPSKSKAVP
jgi:hypothetical protein